MVSLRLLTLADAILLADYHQRNAEFHRPWSPLMPPDYATPAFQEQRLRNYFRRHSWGEQYRFGIFCDADPVQLIGTITLAAVEREFFQNGRLGYSIDQQFQNRGVMTANLQKVIHFSFVEQGLHRLEASIMPHNVASRRVLEKCGFEKIGYSPKYLQIQGVWRDHELYMRLADD
ncbi:GNAT family N-acetyltransferase [Leptolyngbya sp. 7M]|uniref:GNAT family N-acetyltransferase n=1 Tax=Leptolyngbya sp. 7M TaxID=2812896 RepID=UPI001B8ADB54|nr:GNAT family N-acetyltransferase [Leptolyngbya sp. 7M]QYO62465.1 GNAT family N-acetyltransferase [Leptolyngbya sp. 7M]